MSLELFYPVFGMAAGLAAVLITLAVVSRDRQTPKGA